MSYLVSIDLRQREYEELKDIRILQREGEILYKAIYPYFSNL